MPVLWGQPNPACLLWGQRNPACLLWGQPNPACLLWGQPNPACLLWGQPNPACLLCDSIGEPGTACLSRGVYVGHNILQWCIHHTPQSQYFIIIVVYVTNYIIMYPDPHTVPLL